MKKSWKIAAVVAAAILLSTWGATAAENFALGIFGNANMDNTIDEKDIAYVEGVIKGTNAATNLSDADYNGKIDASDIDQIKEIIKGDEKELTVIDIADRIVKITMPVNKIVVLSSDQAEAIKAISGQDKVIGVGSIINDETILLPDLSKLPSVGAWNDPDCEKILELKPDIVISNKAQALDLENKLMPNIKVVALTFSEPRELNEQTRKLGYLIDNRNEADNFIDFIDDYMTTIKERVEELPDNTKPHVYIEGYNDYSAEGKDSKGHQLCEMTGGINIGGNLTSSKVDPEWVIKQNPQIIIKQVSRTAVHCGYNEDNTQEMKKAIDDIKSRTGFNDVDAIKNSRTYAIAPHIIKVPYIVGVTYYAKWLYPDLFKDLDPKAIHQEYLTRFLHLDYELNKHGVFVYPPLNESK
jgi:iron complex transport system substrate-binding protein